MTKEEEFCMFQLANKSELYVPPSGNGNDYAYTTVGKPYVA